MKLLFDKKCLWIAILCLIFSCRIYKLDLDSPSYAILQHTRVDEGHYAMQAIKSIMRDEVDNVEKIDGGKFETWNSSASFINTLLCMVTLRLFGRNYYGLRMAAYFAGLASFFILIKIIFMEEKCAGNKTFWITWGIGMAVVLNFPYFIACRFVDPGIFRILIISITLLYTWKGCRKFGSPQYFGLGFLSVLCVVWGYVTNIFVFMPCGILLFTDIVRTGKRGVRETVRFAGGAAIAYAIGECGIYFVQKTTFLETIIRINNAMGENRVSFSLHDCFNNVMNLCRGNIFSYNSVFTVLAALSVIYVLLYGYRYNDYFKQYLAWMAIGFGLQSIFTNDSLIRKSIVVYLILILIISYLIIDLPKIQERIQNLPRNCKIFIFILVGIIGMFWYCMAKSRLALIEEVDFSSTEKRIVIILNIVALLFLVGFIFIQRWGKSIIFLMVVILPMVLPDSYLLYRYFAKAGYEDKQIMIELKELVGENYVLGGYPYGYCLYNDIIPISSTYDKFLPEEREARAKKLLKSDKVKYFLGNNQKDLIDGWLEDTSYKWILIKKFEKTTRDYGGNWELYLFQKVDCR